MSQKITPFLWFEKDAEKAVDYYVSVFKNSKIHETTHYNEAGAKASGQPAGSVMTVSYTLDGVEFTAINGGPFLKMSGGVSFVVHCKDQKEVDYYWEKLTAGGEAGVCGWINHDKFGVTWQVVPDILPRYLSDPDPVKAERVMTAMVKMTKINIAELEKAYSGT